VTVRSGTGGSGTGRSAVTVRSGTGGSRTGRSVTGRSGNGGS
jgi:hypothetical protein